MCLTTLATIYTQVSIQESSISTFLELADQLGVRGLQTAGIDPTSQQTDHVNSMKNLDTGCKTFGDTGYPILSEKGEVSNQQRESATKESGTILEEPAIRLNNNNNNNNNKTITILEEPVVRLNDANNKTWIQSNHFLGNPAG